MTTFAAPPVLFAAGRVETTAAAAALAASVSARIEELAQQLADDDIDESEFVDGVRAALTAAGVRAGLSDDDILAILDGRADYLDSFAADIGGGLSLAAIASRAGLWGGLAWNMAQIARVRDMSDGAELTWETQADGTVCDDCRQLADGSPYTADSLPTYPAAGDTSCLGNCRCSVNGPGGE